MEKYVTVSAKIPSKLRVRMRKLGLKPSTVFREAIEEALRERNIKALMKELESARRIAAKIPIEDVVKDIREDRDNR